MSDQDTQVIVDTATRASVPQPLNGEAGDATLFSVIVPEGGDHTVIDVEELLAPYRMAPVRKTGHVSVTDAASLIQYVTTHRQPSGTELWADWRQARVIGIVNDHGEEPGWGDHRVTLTLRKTPEWAKWLSRNGTLGSQVEFAEHLEDTANTILSPPAADLLELAQTFHASSSVEFKSQQRLDNGQVQLRYEETITARAGQSGQVTIPPGFLLSLVVFEGSEPVEVGVRLRYRLREGKLLIGYAIDNPELVERDAVERVVVEVERGTDLSALRGTPRS